MPDATVAPTSASPEGTPREVFLAFLRLGMTSFGGPVAHLGYFRAEFVERRRWLGEPAYAELVGLCQFLPGPASSQTGFALGLLRAGPWGALAAWVGFTLPSAVLLVVFALLARGLAASPLGAGLLHGLKLVAVAIVAQGVWGMARTLCPDRPRATIALSAVMIVTVAPVSLGQIAAILVGAVAGLALCRATAAPAGPGRLSLPVSPGVGGACLLFFGGLLLLSEVVVPADHTAGVFAAFYRCGALVFGGGHVVLPLLHAAVVTPGWVSNTDFLAGYGAAQAVPGPLFTFAAYLGAVLRPGPGGVVGALVPLLAIFLPGMLLLVGVIPFWTALRERPSAQAAMHGVNAAVVGLLASALYDPVWTSAVHSPADFALALLCFTLLTVWRAPPLAIVALGAIGGVGLAAFGYG
jgi:chromate transporter